MTSEVIAYETWACGGSMKKPQPPPQKKTIVWVFPYVILRNAWLGASGPFLITHSPYLKEVLLGDNGEKVVMPGSD